MSDFPTGPAEGGFPTGPSDSAPSDNSRSFGMEETSFPTGPAEGSAGMVGNRQDRNFVIDAIKAQLGGGEGQGLDLSSLLANPALQQLLGGVMENKYTTILIPFADGS
eukprot:TRINITY_DN725_c0_g1_i2.p1 TRINITY_DN725_c0_g1~~TRINITY_DN725_c0_g1_i2.p1  ORF type:complete len:121 (-),score=36.26 TRINITY_DN725_c0_g1_i2:220-543(-)